MQRKISELLLPKELRDFLINLQKETQAQLGKERNFDASTIMLIGLSAEVLRLKKEITQLKERT